jgi:hypothetical protein
MFLCLDETPLIDFFQNKISSLVIEFYQHKKSNSTEEDNGDVFACILSVCSKLRYLHFGQSSHWYQKLCFKVPPTIFSSSLLELHVHLERFMDCLYLLDGRFDQLQRLSVKIDWIFSRKIIIDSKVICTHR